MKIVGKITLKEEIENQVTTTVFYNEVVNDALYAIVEGMVNGTGIKIKSVCFGNGGDGKKVSTSQEGFFGVTIFKKDVISLVSDENKNEAIFAFSLEKNECVGQTFNEMGLLMENGKFFSLATCKDTYKTERQKLSWTWEIIFSL